MATKDTEKNKNASKTWYNGSDQWPNVFVKKSERDEDFYKAAIDYAISRHQMRSVKIKKYTDLKDSYNGRNKKTETERLSKMYGEKLHAQYKDYNLSKTKVDGLAGEFTDAPIQGTLYAVNAASLEEKRKVANIIKGMRRLKPQVDKLRKEQLADPFDGYEPPQEETNTPESTFQSMSSKSKAEYVMQKFIDEQIKVKNIKDQLIPNLYDVFFGNECFGKVELGTDGVSYYRNIDIIRAMFETAEDDYFLRKTPYIGEQRWMYVHEIVEEFPKLIKNEATLQKLRNLQTNMGSDSMIDSGYFQFDAAGGLMVNTSTIEFFTYDTHYFKTYKDNQEDVTYMSQKYVESKKRSKQIQSDVKSGRYQLLEKIKKNIASVTRFGNDIYYIEEEVPYIIGSKDNPYETEYNYCGLHFGGQNGLAIGIFEMMEDIKVEYNLCRMVINRELYKAKGVSMGYDRARLPKGKTMKQVISRMMNDSIVDYSSANDGNITGDPNQDDHHLKTVDLGLSKSVQQVIQVAYDCERAMDMISGINKERRGNTPASQTATTAGNNLMASRFSTAGLFYYFNRYISEVIRKLAERRKVGIAYIQGENKAQYIIGPDGVSYIKADAEVADYDYGFYIADGRKEAQIRQIIREYYPHGLQAGEIRPQDMIMTELQETLTEVYQTLNNGWNKIQQSAKAMKDQELSAIAQQQQQKLSVMREDREDKQRHDASMEILKGVVEAGLTTQQAMDQYILNSQLQEQNMEMAEQEQTV